MSAFGDHARWYAEPKTRSGYTWGSRLGTSAGTGKRVIVTAVGSLGDLHPHLAIALGMKARGHDAIVATSECYRQKVLALGLGFRPLRPDSEVVGNPDLMRRYMDLRRGTERVLRDWILPVLRESYEDTLAAAQGRTCSSHTRSPSRPAWSPKRGELERLLEDPEYSRRARNLSGHVRQENGVAAACDALEAMFASDARGDRGPR